MGVFERIKDPLAAPLFVPFVLPVSEGQEWHNLVISLWSPGTCRVEAADSAAIFCNACHRKLGEGLLKSDF